VTAISGISGTWSGGIDRAPERRPRNPQGNVAVESRALVPAAVSPAHAGVPPALGRANAAFLAHLIAVDQDAPQLRVRRRAEPEEALAAYTASAPACVARFLTRRF